MKQCKAAIAVCYTSSHIPVKFHEDIYNSYGVYKIFYNNQRSITQKVKKGEQPFLYATHHLDILHIPKNFMKIYVTITELWYLQYFFYNNQGGITWKEGTIILVFDTSS